MQTLKQRIQLAMKEKACTVTELAAAAKVKPPSVSDWINGKTKTLKGASGARAAKFLGVNVLWLTEGVGPVHSQDVDIEADCHLQAVLASIESWPPADVAKLRHTLNYLAKMAEVEPGAPPTIPKVQSTRKSA